MISTSMLVQQMIKESPLVEDGLAQGIISYSALAREMQPKIQKKLLKNITREAIVMALKRASVQLKKKRRFIQTNVQFNRLTVRSGLIEFTYLNSDSIVEKYKEIFSITGKRNDVFCNLSQGVRETMIVVEEEMAGDVERIFQKEKLIAKIANLSSIIILLSKETVNMPGVYYTVLKLLAWNDISFIDVVSTFSELTIIFSNKDIDQAFSLLKNYQGN